MLAYQKFPSAFKATCIKVLEAVKKTNLYSEKDIKNENYQFTDPTKPVLIIFTSSLLWKIIHVTNPLEYFKTLNEGFNDKLQCVH